MAKKKPAKAAKTKRTTPGSKAPARGGRQDGEPDGAGVTVAPDGVATVPTVTSLLDLTSQGLAALRERVEPRSAIAEGVGRLQVEYERLLKR